MTETSTMLAASIRKSSSSTIVSANSSTSAGGLANAATLMRPIMNGAIHAITRKSRRTSRDTLSRCTFTTTSSPVRSVALCTCAIDAAASDMRSNDEKTSSMRAPKSCSTMVRTVSHGCGGTWSRHFLNSSTNSVGKSPSPLEMI